MEIIKAFVLFLGLSSVFILIYRILLARLTNLSKHSKNQIDDALLFLAKSFPPQFYVFLAFLISIHFLLNIPSFVEGILLSIFVFLITCKVSKIINDIVCILLSKQDKQNSQCPIHQFIVSISRILIWICAPLLILAINGVNITALLAGVGIGGIAIAFASQKILSDLFSAFVIFFDKPFSAGDYIVVDGKDGVVEYIGLKTTRIRSMSGEELIIPNEHMASATIQNFHSVKERRSVLNIGVLYETEEKDLEKISTWLKEIVDNTEKCKFERASLTDLANSSVNFTLTFYLSVDSYTEYLEVQETVLKAIIKKFRMENIEFAYPTQTLYIKK